MGKVGWVGDNDQGKKKVWTFSSASPLYLSFSYRSYIGSQGWIRSNKATTASFHHRPSLKEEEEEEGGDEMKEREREKRRHALRRDMHCSSSNI